MSQPKRKPSSRPARSSEPSAPPDTRPHPPRIELEAPPARPLPDALVPSAELAPPRARRHVQPLGPRVLVRIRDIPARLESGLYLPATAVSTLPEAVLAEVVEVARTQPKTEPPLASDGETDAADDDEAEVTLGQNVSGIPLGALVLFGRDHGVRVPWDDRLRLVEVRHILAIVDEIPEDALQ